MRITFLLLVAFTLFACTNGTVEQESAAGQSEKVSTLDRTEGRGDQADGASASQPILGERIDGPANIRDAINGKLLFTLYDGTLVSSTPIKNDWYNIGLLMDIDNKEPGMIELKAGRKIIVDGQEVGEIKSEMIVYTFTGNDHSLAELIGYTHRDNIRPGTIIENALADHLRTLDGKRSTGQFQSFIKDFDLEKVEDFEGYTVYRNFESWLEDPSPMWRIGLVFEKEELVAILHSRPLQIDGTTDHKLSRAFDCLVYNDTANARELVRMFNQFVNSVD